MPSKRIPPDIASLARSQTRLAINTLANICRASSSDTARVSAAEILLDRGWGKVAQPVTGADGQQLQITVRHLVEGMADSVKTIDAKPLAIHDNWIVASEPAE